MKRKDMSSGNCGTKELRRSVRRMEDRSGARLILESVCRFYSQTENIHYYNKGIGIS